MALPCSTSVEIPRITKPTKTQFLEEYLRHGIPVIITDATEHWPAREWTLDSLCEKVGQNEVCVRGQTNEHNYKVGKKYTIRKTTFQEYTDDLKAANKRAQSSYLAVQSIKQTFPQLETDVPLPEYIGKLHLGPYLWVALKGHYEFCHVDPDDNFLVMIKGRKQVRLFGCEVEPMYPNAKGSKGKTVQSQVDCDNPDFNKFPLFTNAKCHYCELQPGEMLFIPAFWWHQVTSIDTCISVNMFFGDEGKNTYLTKIMEPPRWPIFSYWLLNIVEQNRHHTSFPRILARLPEALEQFLIKVWHEHASAEQLDRLTQLVLEYCGLKELPIVHDSGSKYPPPLKIRGLVWR